MIKLLLFVLLIGLGYQLLQSLRQAPPRKGTDATNGVPPTDASPTVDPSRIVDAQYEEVDESSTP
jgi:hypothetical protein